MEASQINVQKFRKHDSSIPYEKFPVPVSISLSTASLRTHAFAVCLALFSYSELAHGALKFGIEEAMCMFVMWKNFISPSMGVCLN